MSNRELIEEMEKKHCCFCDDFYEGVICGYEISADDEKDTIHDIMYRRKNVCSLDKEPIEIRKQIYTTLKNEGTFFDKLPHSKEYLENKKRKKSNFFDL